MLSLGLEWETQAVADVDRPLRKLQGPTALRATLCAAPEKTGSRVPMTPVLTCSHLWSLLRCSVLRGLRYLNRG